LKFRSDFLTRALKDVENVRLSYQEIHAIAHKCQLLVDISKGEEWDYKSTHHKFPNGEEADVWDRQGAEPKNKKKGGRGFHIGGDERFNWYWIDYEKEWP
jgi:hypothetical protein